MKGLKRQAGMKMIRWMFAMGVAGFVMWSAFSIAAPPAAADGEATYKAKCAMCHGPDGAGDTTMGKKLKVRDLRSADVQKQTDAQIADIISKGKSPMQGYEKSLDKVKIDDVVAFLRELGKKK